MLHPAVASFAMHIQDWPAPVTIADADGDDCPLVFANDRFCALSGYSADEIIGRNCRFLQGDATDRTVTREIAEAIDAREPVAARLINYTKSNRPFCNLITIESVLGPQNMNIVVGTQFEMEDFDERVQMRLDVEPKTDIAERLDKLYKAQDFSEQEREAAAVRHSAVMTLLNSYLFGLNFGLAMSE